MSISISDSKRRSFSEEFKRDAVRLCRERGNLSATARDLGINSSLLYRWTRAVEKEVAPASTSASFPGRGNPKDEQLVKLQRELARLKEENEILKKAVGIFTKRPS
jgi:transposase